MKIWIVILMCLVSISRAWAEDGYEAMKTFIQQEDDRLKDIKLLTLEVEKADLEFKKKEIQSKMAGLTLGVSQDKGMVKAVDGSLDIRLVGVVINGSVKQVFLNVDGAIVYAHEGQDLGSNMKVVKITPQAVSIQYADGKTHQLELSGV